MPRLEGRKSTKKEVKVESLVCASFIMPGETWAWRWRCCVEGCEHRMGPDPQNLRETLESCDPNQLPAHVADKDTFKNIGVACPHHVAEILDRT